jgi:hypothetical protein
MAWFLRVIYLEAGVDLVQSGSVEDYHDHHYSLVQVSGFVFLKLMLSLMKRQSNNTATHC